MGKFLVGLSAFVALMAVTLDQDHTLIWLDNWLAVSAPSPQQALKLPRAVALVPNTVKPASKNRALPGRTMDRKRDTMLDNLAAAYKNQLKIVDGKLVVVELRAKNGIPDALHYRLPQTDILNGEVQGDISQKSATVSVHWPRKN